MKNIIPNGWYFFKRLKFNHLKNYLLSLFLVYSFSFSHAAVMQHINGLVEPKDDFFLHANGNWSEDLQCGVHDEIIKSLKNQTADCIDNIIREPNKRNVEVSSQIRQLYLSMVDRKASTIKSSIEAEFKIIDDIKHKEQIPELVGYLNKIGVPVFIDLETIAPNPSKATKIVGFLAPNEDVPTVGIEDIKKLFDMSGTTPIDDNIAKKILEIAKIDKEVSAKNPVYLQYNTKAKDFEYGLAYSQFPSAIKQGTIMASWANYLKHAGLIDRNNSRIAYIKYSLPYFTDLESKIIQPGTYNLADLKAYFKFRFLYEYKQVLIDKSITSHQEIQKLAHKQIMESFRFELPGICFGDVIERNKAPIDILIHNLFSTYHDVINSSSWMSNTTKAKAIQRLSDIRVEYTPPVFKDSLPISPELNEIDPVANLKFINSSHYYEFRVNRIGQFTGPIELWYSTLMRGFNSAASYKLLTNSITIPLRMLVPPYFQADDNDALNYSGLVFVLGHEMSHAFQPYIDYASTLHSNWMTEQTEIQHFTNAYLDLAKQYHMDTTNIPHLIHMENVADNLGLTIAYAAYIKTLNGKPFPIVNGVPVNQLFFYNYAELWRFIQDCKSQSHHPAPYDRVNNNLRNQSGFYQAFEITSGAMYLTPEYRVKIW